MLSEEYSSNFFFSQKKRTEDKDPVSIASDAVPSTCRWGRAVGYSEHRGCSLDRPPHPLAPSHPCPGPRPRGPPPSAAPPATGYRVGEDHDLFYLFIF